MSKSIEIQMLFLGHDFKYLVESLIKMFYPSARFIYKTEKESLNSPFIISEILGLTSCKVCIKIKINDQVIEKNVPCLCDETSKKDALSKLLYECLCHITNHHPDWGMLTGVRPVKRVRKMLDEGLSETDITKTLDSKWGVSEKKTKLALQIANVQKRLDTGFDKKNYHLYVSIPFCPTRCSYCSFVSQSVENQWGLIDEYLEKLIKELNLTADLAKRKGLKLQTIYIGGGTPTTLSASQLDFLISHIKNTFPKPEKREFTVEAGRPDTITEEKLKALSKHNINRICINPQSFNDDVLEAIGRNHTVKQTLESYKLAKKIGFECINMDFIAGLPNETLESFKNSLETAVSLNPQNITMHALSIKRASDFNREGIKSIDAKEMVSFATSFLKRSGYIPYYLYRQKSMVSSLENVGWSLPSFESPYNIAIMEENESILACGAGSSSKIIGEKSIQRVFNYKYPAEYCREFNKTIEKKKQIEETLNNI